LADFPCGNAEQLLTIEKPTPLRSIFVNGTLIILVG
jgi:hypothetical protein